VKTRSLHKFARGERFKKIVLKNLYNEELAAVIMSLLECEDRLYRSHHRRQTMICT
jgi:hypothetical protein